MDYNNKKLIVSGGIRGDNMGQYALRRRIAELPDLRNFTQADIRTMKGMERIKKKTGIDLFANSLSSKRMETCDDNLEALRLLSRAQLEGKNFNRQKKYIKEHSGAVATAWMDKKNPDETRKKMMKETALNNHFSKVEIDNDVDPQEYEEFEREYLVTKDKLPPIMGDRKPELRIRKLGKHKATGIYFPHKNTIAIDVRDSSSFIHEYAHYLDIATKNNQSLNMEFSNVVRNYTREFKLGDGVPSGKTEYYCTPTEIHSRAFEIYAHERLGINNRLLNPEKFKGFDYGPIMNNPETKEEAFKFFDRVFKKS